MEIGDGMLFLTGLLLFCFGSFLLFWCWGRKRMPDERWTGVEERSDLDRRDLYGKKALSRRALRTRWIILSILGGFLVGLFFMCIPVPEVLVVEEGESYRSSMYRSERHKIVGSYDGGFGLPEKERLRFSSNYVHNATSDTLYMYAVIYGSIELHEYPNPDFYVLNPYSFQEVTELPWYEFSTAPSSVSVPEGSSGRVCWFLDTWEGILESQEGLQHWDSVIRNALIVNTMSDDSEE